jgi:hypothetical protein
VVEAQRVAAAKTACLSTVRHGELSMVAEDFLRKPPA